MTLKSNDDKIFDIANEIAQSKGFQLWGIQWDSHDGPLTLQIFIDGEDGIQLKDCVSISKLISPRLEVEDFIKVPFRLEVSSPGLERPIFTFEQFVKYEGRRVKIKRKKPIGKGRRNYTGTLSTDSNENLIVLETDQGSIKIPMETIARANLVYEP
jgi:ribosome maturation factor RimP